MGIISTQFADILTTTSPTHTFALTVPAGTKRMLVGVHRPYNSDNVGNLASATWNSVAGTVVGASAENAFGTVGVARWTDPTIGAYNLALTFSTTTDRCSLVAVYLDDYGTVDNFASSPFTNSVAVTSAVGRTVIAWTGNTNAASGSVTAGAGETEVAEYAGVNINLRHAVLTEAGAASVTVNPTIDGLGDSFVYGVSVESAGGGGSSAFLTQRFKLRGT